jgi:hypothetical protein
MPNSTSQAENRRHDFAQAFAALFGDLRDSRAVHLASIAHVSQGKPNWTGVRATNAALAGLLANIDTSNLYFSVGMFDPETTDRTKANVRAHRFVVLDDVGTATGSKASAEKVEALRAAGFQPIMVVETSPGNFQYFFRLARDVDAKDIESADALALARVRGAFGAPGWGDPAVQDAARYMRLPGGSTTKPSTSLPMAAWRRW